jgi:hypothetical protein
MGNWVRNGHIRSDDDVLAIDIDNGSMDIDGADHSQPYFSDAMDAESGTD